MNAKTWVPLILAIVLGIVAAKVGKDMIASNNGPSASNAKMRKIVVAKTDLAPGQSLTEADLKMGEVPADAIPRNAFANVGDVLGRVVQTEIVASQAVTETLLTPKGTMAGAPALIPDGMRAATVEVNEYSGVAGLLAPGCRVDVIGSLRDERGGQHLVRTLVENVKVLAVGSKMGSVGKEGEAGLPRSVTLLVDPRQAETIELATTTGRTRLVLRGSFDQATHESTGVSVAELIGVHRARHVDESQSSPTTRPSALANRGVKAIQMIRRGELTTVQVEVRSPAGPAGAVTGTDGGTVVPE